MSARNRELIALLPAAIIVTAGFATIFLERDDLISDVSLTYGAVYLGLCVAVHAVIRVRLPNADPYIFPLIALIAGFGLVELYRISDVVARDQAQWFVIGLVLFAATIVFFKDYAVLERYRYTIALGSIALLAMPRVLSVVGLGEPTNGAYLSVQLGPVAFQPAEFAKIGIVVFLASYLRDTRQVLIHGGNTFLGVSLPPLRHLGPLLLIWGAAMFMLVFIRDLGSSLMFFGGFLALVYVATGKKRYPLAGVGAFAAGAYVLGSQVGHVQDRVAAWRTPFEAELYDGVGGSYQLANGLYAQADGGLFGAGLGQGVFTFPGSDSPNSLLPAAQTDLIYAAIANETGLLGVVGLLVGYLLVVQRGFRIASLARDPFSKLLATGLTSVFALQVFVIVGGVTKVIPLTGVTLPFASYGGSSVMANFILLALLLLVSEKARRPA